MQKTAKVTGILACKPFDSKNGRIWYHKLEMDNGEVGEIGKKTENAFKIGDPLTYTSEDSQYGLKFKAVTDYNGSGGFQGKGGSRGSTASFALSYSKDLIIAQIAAGKTADITTAALIEAAIVGAGRFNVWMKENEN